jgi:hypothetical protein
MESTIRLRIKKELSSTQQKSILKLKGAIISQGFTDIIHIRDEGEEFHINYFSVLPGKKAALHDYLETCLSDKDLGEAVSLL